MDLIDKKILALLDQNCRMPSSLLAKKVHVSRQVVDYRIKQLQKDVILHFTALLDPTVFVSNIWHVYLKLQNLDQTIEENLLCYLNDAQDVWWLAVCQGEWDLIFSVAGNDIFSFDKFMLSFRSTFSQYIAEGEITSYIKADTFPRGYFLNKPTLRKTWVSERRSISLDKQDYSLLRIISTQARLKATEIAKKTGMTSRQVLYRLKELQKKEVIRALRLHLDISALGYSYYKVCFYTQHFTHNSEQQIISWCEKNPYVLYYVRKISPWTFEIEFETTSYQELTNTLKELRNLTGDVIRRTTVSLIIKEYKGELNILKHITA